MAQYAKLVSQYHPDGVYSFIVGSVDIVANTLYVRDSNGLLVQADASSVGPFFVPLTAEKAGYPVSAALVGTGTFVLLASGSIAKDAKLTNAAFLEGLRFHFERLQFRIDIARFAHVASP